MHLRQGGRVLDWQLSTLGRICNEFMIITGFETERILQAFPGIRYGFNEDWENTSTVASLLKANLSGDNEYLISYSDVLFRPPFIETMKEIEGDVVVGIDSNWTDRYEYRSEADRSIAEVLTLAEGKVVRLYEAHDELKPHIANAEFTGLLLLRGRAVKALLELAGSESTASRSLPWLINQFLKQGLSVGYADAMGDWAELNAAQDLAQFILGTKGETLVRLRPMVRHSKIGELVTFTSREWHRDELKLIRKIMDQLGPISLIVRSSAKNEDGFTASNAGHYKSIPNVDGGDEAQLSEAIRQVLSSYQDDDLEHQVLVQEMVTDVVFGGVALTRTLSYGAPYYCINYDDSSGRTDTVTSGVQAPLKTLLIHKGFQPDELLVPRQINVVLEALRELESLVGHDSLDIEFAVDGQGLVHIFQVRPIVVGSTRWSGSDEALFLALANGRKAFSELQRPSPFVLGDRTVFSIMTDWNPAEMIGTRPRRLAYSLYADLITDRTWAIQRDEYGYRRVLPQKLMHSFAGHAYIDVRASLNSFIPKALEEGLAKRLVDSQLDCLTRWPDAHDKVEFEIALTCLTFDFHGRTSRLSAKGFSSDELDQLKDALCEITESAIHRVDSDLDQTATLNSRFESLRRSRLPPLRKAMLLLEDCRTFGTLPFAHLARAGFVAVALLDSAVSEGFLPIEEREAFLRSLNTVTSSYASDLAQMHQGTLSRAAFLEKYGHLRPGTYDITVQSYRSSPDLYHGAGNRRADPPHSLKHEFRWDETTAARLELGLRELGLKCTFSSFEYFLRQAITGREYSKFCFSRNVSLFLDLIQEFGAALGFTVEQLSHLSIDDLACVDNGLVQDNVAVWLKHRIDEQRLAHELSLGIELPPLLSSEKDFLAFTYPTSRPTFIGRTKVTANPARLGGASCQGQSLEGRIVMVPQADPGYDWIFGYPIAGLITLYGGGNSHMAIRSAEFELPAAIGVGEEIYATLLGASLVTIDCPGRKVFGS
jgi:choline kinase